MKNINSLLDRYLLNLFKILSQAIQLQRVKLYSFHLFKMNQSGWVIPFCHQGVDFG